MQVGIVAYAVLAMSFTTVVMDLFLARYVTHCSLTPESKLKPHGTP